MGVFLLFFSHCLKRSFFANMLIILISSFCKKVFNGDILTVTYDAILWILESRCSGKSNIIKAGMIKWINLTMIKKLYNMDISDNPVVSYISEDTMCEYVSNQSMRARDATTSTSATSLSSSTQRRRFCRHCNIRTTSSMCPTCQRLL